MTSDYEKLYDMVVEIHQIYGRKMSPKAIERWCELWLPYDSSRLEIAISAVAGTCEFMPSISALKSAVSYLYPTALALDVANEWARLKGSTAALPTQVEIDEILRGWNKSAGAVLREHLLPK